MSARKLHYVASPAAPVHGMIPPMSAVVPPVPLATPELMRQKLRRAAGPKCERCWHYRASVGSDPDLPAVCAPCAGRLREGWPELVGA